MNHKIRSIDLKHGQFVIVSSWLDEQGRDYTKPINGPFGTEIYATRKPVGDPMKVLSVALPYITVELVSNKTRGVVDTRLIELTLVDRQYVKSLSPKYFDAEVIQRKSWFGKILNKYL